MPLVFKLRRGLLGVGKGCRFEAGSQSGSWVCIQHTWRGFAWKSDSARWQLRNYGGLSRRMVLFRNGELIAAVQYHGRQMHTWIEVIYDGRGYRISQARENPQQHTVKDQVGDLLLTIFNGNQLEVTLECPLPVHLIILVVFRIIEVENFQILTILNINMITI